jgi:hypothetical protein
MAAFCSLTRACRAIHAVNDVMPAEPLVRSTTTASFRRLSARVRFTGSVDERTIAWESPTHVSCDIDPRSVDLVLGYAGNVGLTFQTRQQIRQGLPLSGMGDGHRVQIDGHEPVEQHDRIGTSEFEVDLWQGRIHTGIMQHKRPDLPR